MIIDSYDITSEPIIKLENFYGEKQHLVKKCMVVFSKVIYEYMLEKFPCRQIAEVRACNEIYRFGLCHMRKKRLLST